MELADAGTSGEAKFADVMERALYNGINSGMSLDGKPIAIAIRWCLTQRENREIDIRLMERSVMRGMTRPAAHQTLSERLHRFLGIFTAQMRTAFTFICMTTRR